MDGFYAKVLEWHLKTYPADEPERVTRVEPYGTEWAGDTEGGFYNEFELTIYYLWHGAERTRYITRPDDLVDLWNFLIRPESSDV